MLNDVISQAKVKDKLTLRETDLDVLVDTAMQPLRCMMTFEVTQAQPFPWVMEPLLPSAGSTKAELVAIWT